MEPVQRKKFITLWIHQIKRQWTLENAPPKKKIIIKNNDKIKKLKTFMQNNISKGRHGVF